jgi:hypothetical protein
MKQRAVRFWPRPCSPTIVPSRDGAVVPAYSPDGTTMAYSGDTLQDSELLHG